MCKMWRNARTHAAKDTNRMRMVEFWKVWDEAWDRRQKQAVRWRSMATYAQKLACAMLRIPKTLVKAPRCKGYSLWRELANFQYHLVLGVTQLRARYPCRQWSTRDRGKIGHGMGSYGTDHFS